MKKLTVAEMKAAIYARSCDLDPDSPGENTARRDEKDGYPGSVAKYKEGKRILEHVTLRYGHRSTVHTMSNNRIPGEDEAQAGWLRVDAGYIGSAQAYMTAIFNER